MKRPIAIALEMVLASCGAGARSPSNFGGGDGVADSVDECPDEPEDHDGFEDGDGCPDPDNDHDGIPDVTDQCPNAPGPAASSGCPTNAH